MTISLSWVTEYAFQFATITVVGYLFTNVKIQNKQYRATQAGVRALLRDRLISAIHKAKKQGFIYIHELENIDKMYKEYVNLGGNGALVHMMGEVSKLETKTDITN